MSVTSPAKPPIGREQMPACTAATREVLAVKQQRARLISAALAWLPFILCCIPSALLLAFVPPTFNFSDAATLLTYDMNMLVPHWPPFYPSFVRFFTSLLGYSDAAIYTIVVIQQLTAVAAALYITSAFRGVWRRVIAALSVVIANYFFVYSHGIYTEAMSNAFLLLFFGSAMRLALVPKTELDRVHAQLIVELPFLPPARPIAVTQRRVDAILNFSSLVLMTLTRYNMFIFAALLPCFYIWRAVCNSPSKRIVEKLKPVTLSILAGLLALAIVQGSSFLFCKMLACDLTSKFGRPACYRLHELPWDTMPRAEKEHLQSNMRRHCPDDFTRFALKIMIEDNNPWIGSYRMIEAMAPSFHSNKTVDQTMNAAAIAFFMTPNKYLVHEIISTYGSYMGKNNSTFESVLNLSSAAIPLYRSGKDIDEKMKRIPMVHTIDVSKYKLVSRVVNPVSFDRCSRYVPLCIAAIVICAIAVFAGGASLDSLGFVLALALSVLLYSIISSAVTEFVPRYLLPVNAAVWLMIALALASFGQAGRKTKDNTVQLEGVNT